MSIVIGYIPNQFGEAALTHGLAEARRRGTDVVVVNSTRGDALVDERYVGREGLVELERRLAASGVDHGIRQSVERDVGEAIVAVADEVGADLIVIGIRHRSPVGKMLMGSVAQRVIIEASCPVLAVKPAG